jgi:NAD(P)H-hydrate epimerase
MVKPQDATSSISAVKPMPNLLWTRQEAQAFDRHLQEDLGLPAAILMENAAAGLANKLLQVAQDKGFRRILLICGTGHNGGDALVAARQLQGCGLEFRLALPLGSPRPGNLAAAALLPLASLGLHPAVPGQPLKGLMSSTDLVVDALFGLGLDRPLHPPAVALMQELNDARLPTLAVDLPSGLDADTGATWGAAVRADWTVTFVGPKQGFGRGQGPALCGEVSIAGIGVRMEYGEGWLRTHRILAPTAGDNET